MNVRPVEPGSVAEEQKVAALMANVERLVAERRDADAQRLWREAQAILPNHPLVLHERARRFLVGGDPAAACALLEQLVAMAPQQLPFWLSLAAALRSLSRREEELQALERALALDPTHLVVLLQKGALLDLMNKPRSAAAVYGHALQSLATGTPLPPAVEAHVRHAEKRVRENAAHLGELIDARLGELRQAGDVYKRQLRDAVGSRPGDARAVGEALLLRSPIASAQRRLRRLDACCADVTGTSLALTPAR